MLLLHHGRLQELCHLLRVANGFRCWDVHVLERDMYVRVHTGVHMTIAIRSLRRAVESVLQAHPVPALRPDRFLKPLIVVSGQ